MPSEPPEGSTGRDQTTGANTAKSSSRRLRSPQAAENTRRVLKIMAKFLSQDQINEFKECFSLYDKKQKGKIKASDLMAVMRCLGASPTPGEVQRHLHLHKIERNAELDFSTFLNIMYRQLKQEEPEQEILTALAMIDRQKRGVITASELRAKLTRLGEKLSEAEVDDLLKEAKVAPNGTIKYEEFVRIICLPTVDY
ncbi:calmodulin-like protein 4 [Podargus strigoides]